MDALRKEKAYTIADIYALPDGERAELIIIRTDITAPIELSSMSLFDQKEKIL